MKKLKSLTIILCTVSVVVAAYFFDSATLIYYNIILIPILFMLIFMIRNPKKIKLAMNYIKTQSFLPIFFDIIQKLTSFAIISCVMSAVVVAFLFGLLNLFFYNIILMPILFILSFIIKDCPKEIKLGMVFIMLTQAYLVYQAFYYPDFFIIKSENVESVFALELFSYLLNINPEINDALIAVSALTFITIPIPFLASFLTIISISKTNGYINKHRKIAQDKFDNLSNHEKLLKIK